MKNKGDVKVFALGGLDEIGKNMYGVEYKGEIILIDCGIKFPTDDLLGIDYVIPNYKYLEDKQKQIKGLIITHGHEDHIGGIPFLLKKINVPIYGGKMSLGLIKSKLQEHGLTRGTKLIEIDETSVIKFKHLSVEFIRTTHSIPDSFAVCLKTPYGYVVHTGDFKFDFTPEGGACDLRRMGAIGSEGVFCLLSDSTNSEVPGFSDSEKVVKETIFEIVSGLKGRLIFATFASNIFRLQQAIEASIKFNRKIVVIGRSMEKSIRIGRSLGYIKAPDETFITMQEINVYPANRITVLCTGSQGEPMAALGRIANGSHRHISLIPDDTVVFSSSPIPGNVKSVNKVIDRLTKAGATVIHNKISDIHTSGHGTQEEQKLMLNLLKPKYFVPIHGEHRMQVKHAELGVECGILPEEAFVLDNGDVLALNEKKGQVIHHFPAEPIYVDGSGIGDIGNVVLKDRRLMADSGVVVVTMTLDTRNGKMISNPVIISRGFVYMRESQNLLKKAEETVTQEVLTLLNQNETQWSEFKRSVSDSLRQFFYQRTGRSPMILPLIMEP